MNALMPRGKRSQGRAALQTCASGTEGPRWLLGSMQAFDGRQRTDEAIWSAIANAMARKPDHDRRPPAALSINKSRPARPVGLWPKPMGIAMVRMNEEPARQPGTRPSLTQRSSGSQQRAAMVSRAFEVAG